MIIKINKNTAELTFQIGEKDRPYYSKSFKSIEEARQYLMVLEHNLTWSENEDSWSARYITSIDSVLVAANADEVWGMPEGTVKRDLSRKKFLPHEAKKSGRPWIVTLDGLLRLYGQPENIEKAVNMLMQGLPSQ